MENSGSSPSNNFLLKIVRDIADYQFGRGVGEKLFTDDCKVEVSKRTKRPRHIYLDGKILATIRYPDNLLALTPLGARKLIEIVGDLAPKVIVRKNATDRVRKGLAPHPHEIIHYDDRIRPGDEVLILCENGELLAVGKAVISGSSIKGLIRGSVVKIRKSVKEP